MLSLQISCVGGFGSNSQMYKINGTANINAIRAASEAGALMNMFFVLFLLPSCVISRLLRQSIRSSAVPSLSHCLFNIMDFVHVLTPFGSSFFLSVGVRRFVYISAADFGLVNYLLQGYYEGKV